MNETNKKILIVFLSEKDNKSIFEKWSKSPNDKELFLELNKRFKDVFHEMRLTKYISLIIKRSAIEFDICLKNKTNLDDHLKDDIKCAVTEEKTSNLEEVIGDENILELYNKLLTEVEKRVLNLHFLAGYKMIEIASMLKISQQAVSKMKLRALNKIRDGLYKGG